MGTTRCVADWDLERHLRQLGLSKRSVLEASVYALQEGEALLQKLNALWHAEWIDSRTDCLRTPVARAISQVRQSQVSVLLSTWQCPPLPL